MSVAFDALVPNACRFPLWRPGERTGLFCGDPATVGPYCTEHHGICTEPVTPDALNYLRFIGTVGGRWRGSSVSILEGIMPNIEAGALAATLRACAREGETYEAITRASLLAADLLERQAAQLAALRTGADTEDLHAAADSWQRRALEAEATLDARSVGYAEAVEAVRSEIRRQALEEAALVADRMVNKISAHLSKVETPATTHPGSVGACDAAEIIARRIRALADKPAAGGEA